MPFRATFAGLYASYQRGGDEGHYQGLYASFAYHAPWWGAELLLPAYRLEQRGGSEYGLGDLVLSARGALYRAREGDLELGVELPLLLPTGNQQLGIGHVMPMPDVYFSLHAHPAVLRVQAGYGRKIGSSDPRQPIVNPLNDSEFEHAFTLGLGLRRDLIVHVRWWGALPVSGGVLRQALAGGASVNLEWFDMTLELQRALTGSAFEWRELVQLGAIF